MGLDVTLERYYLDPVVVTAHQVEVDRLQELEWSRGGGYDAMNKAGRDACSARTKAIEAAYLEKHGLKAYGKYGSLEHESVDYPSALWPDHIFKRGYFRSSYNDSGFDSVMRDYGVATLAQVFAVGNDDYVVRPLWALVRAAAEGARERFRQAMAEHGKYRVVEVSEHSVSPRKLPSTRREALELFTAERKKWEGEGARSFGHYSNAAGLWFESKPPVVRACIEGEVRDILGRGKLPAVFMVVEDEHEEGEGLDWYLRAWDVVLETIDWVLAQEDPAMYALSWSG